MMGGRPVRDDPLRLRGEGKRWLNVLFAAFMYLKMKLLSVVGAIRGVTTAARSVGSGGFDCSIVKLHADSGEFCFALRNRWIPQGHFLATLRAQAQPGYGLAPCLEVCPHIETGRKVLLPEYLFLVFSNILN